MNPKYHIAKRNYLYDVIKSIIGSFFVAGIILSRWVDPDSEAVIELTPQQSLIITSVFLVALIAQLIVYWLILRKHQFSEQDQSFLIEKGLFFKKKTDIPYKNIHTLSIKRGFFDLILGLSTLQFDTGTTSTFYSEAHLVLDKDYAPVLKEFIEQRKSNEAVILPSPRSYQALENDKSTYFYEPKWSTLMIMGILKPGFLAFAYLLTFATLIISSVIIYFDTETAALSIFLVSMLINGGIIVIFGIFLMLFHLIRFYHYRLTLDGDDITYQYGLLNKVQFKLPKQRINAVHVSQSLLYQWFHCYELNVSAIGIGDQLNQDQHKIESKSLLPIANLQQLNQIIDYLGYSREDESKPIKPKKYRYLNFIGLPLTFLIIINLLPYLLFPIDWSNYVVPLILHLILVAVMIWGLSLQLKNHLFQSSNQLMMFQRGAYTIKQTYLKTNKIQMIAYEQGPLLLLEKIGNIQINYKDLGGIIVMKSYEYNTFASLTTRIDNKQ